MADLRECVTGETLVLLSDGRRVPIRDLVGTTPDVLTTMTAEGRIGSAASDLVWEVGRRPVFEVRLASGHCGPHARGSTASSGARGLDLASRPSGSATASRWPARLPEPADPVRWPEARLVLLGHLVGDGSYGPDPSAGLRYTTASEKENSQAVAEAAQAEFGGHRGIEVTGGAANWHQTSSSVAMGTDGTRPGSIDGSGELGIFGQRSTRSRLPPAVFSLSNDQVALLLRHLLGDRRLHLRPEAGSSRGSEVISFATSSPRTGRGRLRIAPAAGDRGTDAGRPRSQREAARDQRPGLLARRPNAASSSGSGPSDLARGRPNASSRGSHLGPGRDERRYHSHLPESSTTSVRRCVAPGSSHREMAKLRGTSCGGMGPISGSPRPGRPSPPYAEILDDDGLRRRANDDLFWDRVVEGPTRRRGGRLRLDRPRDGVLARRQDRQSQLQGAVEQDADLVVLLHRPEYYDPNDQPGIAELIVAKNSSNGRDRLR